jgi:sensor c-di-GMP phosphodiesterase-like protein
LGLLVSHAADWILEAQNGITSFEQFLDTHPEFDYRQIPADTEEHTFARANKLKEAIFAARKAGVPVDANDYEKLYNAMKYLKEVKK